MKTVQLSQAVQYSCQRMKNMAVITLHDQIQQHTDAEGVVSYTANQYQLQFPWREGLTDPSNYVAMLAHAKKLEAPKTVTQTRIARDIVL